MEDIPTPSLPVCFAFSISPMLIYWTCPFIVENTSMWKARILNQNSYVTWSAHRQIIISKSARIIWKGRWTGTFQVVQSRCILFDTTSRFAQFFICPLFTESCTDREMQAVDSGKAYLLQCQVPTSYWYANFLWTKNTKKTSSLTVGGRINWRKIYPVRIIRTASLAQVVPSNLWWTGTGTDPK